MSTPSEGSESGTGAGTGPKSREKTVGNGFFADVWLNLKRWLIKTARHPFVVVASLIQPIIFLVLFTEVFGGIVSEALFSTLGENISYVTYLTPAIIIQSALIAAAGSGIGMVDDMENGMFEKILVSPINRGAMFFGKALSEVVRIIAQTLLILGLGYVLLWFDTGGSVGTYIETGLLGVLGVIVVAVVFAVWFTALSNIVALITRDQESTIIGANLLQFPLLLVSSAFIPLRYLPEWVQTVATYNPFTYGVDAARSLMLGQDTMKVLDVTAFSGIWNAVIPALAVLIAVDFVFGGIAVYYLNRASSASAR